MTINKANNTMILRQLGLQDYQVVSQAMHVFTDRRNEHTLDEFWLVQHYPVFTQGLAGKPEHLLSPGEIPVIKSDRGGQVTYHGPGQQIVYLLIDLKRHKISVRQLVTIIENCVINTLNHFNICSHARPEAPGVYVGEKKICSLGLKIRKGCSFHGLALNVSMDLTPFQKINPCGYAGLQMTQISEFVPDITIQPVAQQLIQEAKQLLGYHVVKNERWHSATYL